LELTFDIYAGQACEDVDLGDVFFWIVRRDGKKPEFQHAAICHQEGPFKIGSSDEPAAVLEVVTLPDKAEWPNRRYSVQVVGQMQPNGRVLSKTIRRKVVDVGWRIILSKQNIINVLGEKDGHSRCEWAAKPYKCVLPDPLRPESATEMHFTCATFVEYCYEQAGVDIVLDGPDGAFLPRVSWEGESLPRLFPGYLIKAFQDDKYPLDIRLFGDPLRFAHYPFS
jgi:hypothetical protein